MASRKKKTSPTVGILIRVTKEERDALHKRVADLQEKTPHARVSVPSYLRGLIAQDMKKNGTKAGVLLG